MYLCVVNASENSIRNIQAGKRILIDRTMRDLEETSWKGILRNVFENTSSLPMREEINRLPRHVWYPSSGDDPAAD